MKLVTFFLRKILLLNNDLIQAWEEIFKFVSLRRVTVSSSQVFRQVSNIAFNPLDFLYPAPSIIKGDWELLWKKIKGRFIFIVENSSFNHC